VFLANKFSRKSVSDTFAGRSRGHIRDLSKRKMPTVSFPYPIAGIDLDSGDNTADYVVLEPKRALVNELIAAAARADLVIFATDPDLEGDAMAWHLYQTIMPLSNRYPCNGSGSPKSPPPPLRLPSRTPLICIWSPPKKRVACWTVSPALPCHLLWKCIAPGLSAGRVQSVVLRLIVDRELDHWRIVPATYYDLTAALGLATTTMTTTTAAADSRPKKEVVCR
jgi:DNA topoisomerase I